MYTFYQDLYEMTLKQHCDINSDLVLKKSISAISKCYLCYVMSWLCGSPYNAQSFVMILTLA